MDLFGKKLFHFQDISDITTSLNFDITMNGQQVNATKFTQDIFWVKPKFTSQDDIESHLKGEDTKRQRHSVFQCHLFTHFNLITFGEKKFSFPSNIGTYLLFRDDIEDFEVIN